MTFTRYHSQQRDVQDQVKRGVWGELGYTDGAGAYLSVRGTGTVDEEVPLLNLGYGFNMPANSNAEMVMLSMGSDVNDKMVLATLPRDKQHQWGEGQGGIQSPVDPSRRVEFNGDETWLKDGVFVLGHDKAARITINGSSVTIELTGDTTINTDGDLTLAATNVEISSASLTHNGINIGDDHAHGGVDPGGGTTGGPV